MKAVFITGTDTGAGKTVVAGLLGRYISERGYRVVTQKWVQTGSPSHLGDIEEHLVLMGKKAAGTEPFLKKVLPYNLKFPSSPHLAASLEKRKIDPKKIRESLGYLSDNFDVVIVEGIGGALVPYNRRRLVIDIAKDLDLPVIIVAQNRLGAINHTLLTVEALRSRRMEVLGIIFNGANERVDRKILKDNPRILKALTGERILGELPWMRKRGGLYKKFIPIGKRVVAQLKRDSLLDG